MKTQFRTLAFALVFVFSPTGYPQQSQVLAPGPAEIPPLGLNSRLSELPFPPTAESIALGRSLFFDKRLSQDGSVSCASCHQPKHAFSEPRSVSEGVLGKLGTRKSPPLINLSHPPESDFFWDGRATSLEEQVLMPLFDPVEMGNTAQGVLTTVRSTRAYRRGFNKAFGRQSIELEDVAKALADYVRSLRSGGSRFDRWMAGEHEALSAKERCGYEVFIGKGRCMQCHLGESFTDRRFHNLGIGWDASKQVFADPGRFGVTGKALDMGAFRTPTLRDVSKHAPYMHDGSLKNLRNVIDWYDKGGGPNPALSPRIEALSLSETEKKCLEAFLRSLDGIGYDDSGRALLPGKAGH